MIRGGISFWFKKKFFIDPREEVFDDVENNLLYYQVFFFFFFFFWSFIINNNRMITIAFFSFFLFSLDYIYIHPLLSSKRSEPIFSMTNLSPTPKQCSVSPPSSSNPKRANKTTNNSKKNVISSSKMGERREFTPKMTKCTCRWSTPTNGSPEFLSPPLIDWRESGKKT